MNLRRAVWKIFSIQNEELGFTIPLFILYLLSGSFFAVGQIYSETIFLKAYGAEGLSRFFIYNGIVLIIMGILYNSILLRLSLKRGYFILIVLFAGLIFAASFLSVDAFPWLPFYLYLGNYLFTFFLDIHFFNYAYQFLSLRSSKRLLPFIMGGGKLGGIAASLLFFAIFSQDISRFGVYVWALNGSLLLIPVLFLGIYAGSEIRPVVRGGEFLPDNNLFERIFRKIKLSYSSPIFTFSVFAIFAMSVVNQISEFYFARIFNTAFATKSQLASFLSIYTFIADGITLLVQVFLASRIIHLLGVKRSNYVYPVSFLSFISICAFFPNILVGILLRFFRKNLSLIIRTPIFNVIMASAPRDRMPEVKSFISALISPLGMITGGAAIMLIYRDLTPAGGFVLAIFLGLIYLLLTGLQNRAYVQSLKNRLTFDTDHRESELAYTDYRSLLSDGKYTEEELSLLELIFNEHPTADILRALYPHFERLSAQTRINIVTLMRTGRYESKGAVLRSAVRDSELRVRIHALALLRELPPQQRRAILAFYCEERSMGEQYAIELLHADKSTVSSGLDVDSFVIKVLAELRTGILKGELHVDEFIAFVQVLPCQYYLSHLYELLLKTRDERLFLSIIPVADHLSREEAQRVLYLFRGRPLIQILGFSQMAASLTEMDRLMLLDYRDDLDAHSIEKLYRPDDQARGVVVMRLFSERSHARKSNYLNYLLHQGMHSEREMVEYINFEIIRIIDILETLSLIRHGKNEDLVSRFISIALWNEIELHKHLILKAIAILTGLKIDEVYESNLLLKDEDLNSYILEYLESSGKHTRQVLFAFEEEMDSDDILDLMHSEDISLKDSLRRTKQFIPEIAALIDFCLKASAGETLPVAESSETNLPKMEVTMLSLIEKILFLRENGLFAELKLDELIQLAKITRELDVPASRVIIREGETGDELFIIVDGEVEVYTGEQILARLGRESCIGELSIIDKEPRSASVRTVSRTRFLSISRRDFLLTLKENPSISINIMKMITGRLRERIA